MIKEINAKFTSKTQLVVTTGTTTIDDITSDRDNDEDELEL